MDHPAPHPRRFLKTEKPHPGPDPPQVSDDSGRTSRVPTFRHHLMAWEEARSMKHGGNRAGESVKHMEFTGNHGDGD